MRCADLLLRIRQKIQLKNPYNGFNHTEKTGEDENPDIYTEKSDITPLP